jgi:hypothetical protein
MAIVCAPTREDPAPEYIRKVLRIGGKGKRLPRIYSYTVVDAMLRIEPHREYDMYMVPIHNAKVDKAAGTEEVGS